METEAERLFAILYDMKANGDFPESRGFVLRNLLENAESDYQTEQKGRSGVLGLLFYLVKITKRHFRFILKRGTLRKRIHESTLKAKNSEAFFEIFEKVSEDVENVVFITPAEEQWWSQRENQLMEILYTKSNNFDTYAIFGFIRAAGKEGITYAQISQKYNIEFGPHRQLSPIKVANYCKKMLEKNGFIRCTSGISEAQQKGSEKVVIQTKYFYNSLNLCEHCIPLPKGKRQLTVEFDIEAQGNRHKRVTERKEELDILKHSLNAKTLRQIIGGSISSTLAQENGGLTIGEIAYVCNMENSEKAVNRILEQMTKSNPQIYGSTAGSGKIRLNKYLLSDHFNKIPKVEHTQKSSPMITEIPLAQASLIAESLSPIIELLRSSNSYTFFETNSQKI